MERGTEERQDAPEGSGGIRAAGQMLQSEAAEIGREAKRVSNEIIGDRVDRVFGVLDDVENAVRAAARELDSGAHPLLANYVTRAADELAATRERIEPGNIKDMIGSAEEFCRRRPMAALGMAFAAGFAVVRFLKSASDEQGGNSFSYENTRGGGRSAGDYEFESMVGERGSQNRGRRAEQ
jgi:hypothetical protein